MAVVNATADWEWEWMLDKVSDNSASAVLVAVLAVAVSAVLIWKQSRQQPKKAEIKENVLGKKKGENAKRRIRVVYGSSSGKAEVMAREMEVSVTAQEGRKGIDAKAVCASQIDPEEFLTAEAGEGATLLVLLSTWTGGEASESARWLDKWLEESASDFRVQHCLLDGIKFAVFGLGDSAYGGENFNAAARRVDRNLGKLGAARLAAVCLGDDSDRGIEADFEDWRQKMVDVINGNEIEASKTAEEYHSSDDDESEAEEPKDDQGLVDLEDIGEVMAKSKPDKNGSVGVSLKSPPKEMLNPSLRKSLTKQGYQLVGSHSGVKICRWTKAMLRGRGGCYKHTFYGIASHRCMEVV